ncbi:MAG: DUF438 domain-containing protein [Candidatus Izimaplasma sp.]|nr:DUF438 domain-containing protein [Candidatus Izimaplasma bacterium]
MSELINNSQKRQEKLKEIIKKIHDGMPIEEAKKEFKKHFESVSTDEITKMEHNLIEEGMPIEEVENLCDVHASVFQGSISDIHKTNEITEIKGHPLQVLMEENDRILTLIEEEIVPYLDDTSKTAQLMLRIGFERLSEVDYHYARKENLFFPQIEKAGITSVPKVMWGVDNQIRDGIKDVIKELASEECDLEALNPDIKITLEKVKDMVTKENNILIPMLIDNVNLYQFILIDEASQEMKYFLEPPKHKWAKQDDDMTENKETTTEETNASGEVLFDAGTLSQEEVNSILNTVPFDMTFVDKEGHVKYFTQGKERMFDRPKTILGRHVSMCHPPQSVDVVEEIVRRFETGEKDHEDFWIKMGEVFAHIRYYAIRDKNNNFLGTLELTQDIKPIKDLEGEKRLLDE